MSSSIETFGFTGAIGAVGHKVETGGTKTEITSRDVDVDRTNITEVNGKQVLNVTSGGTNVQIPLDSLTREQYIALVTGKSITLPIDITTITKLPDITT